MTGSICLTALLTLTANFSARVPEAQDIKLALKSAYLVSGFKLEEKPYHQVGLVGTIKGEAGEAKLILDPNTCTLNSFGDTEICTQIALHTVDVKLARIRIEDPLKLGRLLFSITGDKLPKAMFLVVPTNEKAGHRLVLKPEKDAGNVVLTLEPATP